MNPIESTETAAADPTMTAPSSATAGPSDIEHAAGAPDVAPREQGGSAFDLEEKLSLLYWAGAGAVVVLAVQAHAVALVLLAPLLYDAVRHARSGRSAGARLFEVVAFYRRLSERDRRAAAGSGIVMQPLREVWSHASSSVRTLLPRSPTAPRRPGGKTAGEELSATQAAAHGASQPAPASAGTVAGYERLLAVAARALRATPADLAGVATDMRGGVTARGSVTVAYVAVGATAGALAVLAQPMFAVALPALAVDYALWRWQGSSLVADLCGARPPADTQSSSGEALAPQHLLATPGFASAQDRWARAA